MPGQTLVHSLWVKAVYLAAFIANFFLWAIDGVNTVLHDGRALIDSALYWQGYHIYVMSGHRPSPSPSPPRITPTSHATPTPTTGTTETITVSSTEGWQPTGIYLTGGEKFTVRYVSGSWTVDYRNFPHVGPGGYSDQEDAQIYQDCKYGGNVNYAVLFGIVDVSTLNGAFPIGEGVSSPPFHRASMSMAVETEATSTSELMIRALRITQEA